MSLILPPNPDIELIKSELQFNYKKQFQNTLIESVNAINDQDDKDTTECLSKDLLNDYCLFEIFLFEYVAQRQGSFIQLDTCSNDDLLINSHLFKFLAKLVNTTLIKKFNSIKQNPTIRPSDTTDFTISKQNILNECIDLYKNSIRRFNIDMVLVSFDKDINNWLKWCKYNNLKSQDNDCLPPMDDSIFVVFSIILNQFANYLATIDPLCFSNPCNFRNKFFRPFLFCFRTKFWSMFDVVRSTS